MEGKYLFNWLNKHAPEYVSFFNWNKIKKAEKALRKGKRIRLPHLEISMEGRKIVGNFYDE